MRNHKLIFFIVVCLVGFGIYSLPHMKKDEFPQFTISQGVIAVVYPGATAQEVEAQVTKPLERYLFTFNEFDKEMTYSVTEDGICYIYAFIRFDVTDRDAVWAKLRPGLSLFKQTSLPSGVLAVVVVDDFGNTSSMLLAVESEERTPRELEHYCNDLCDRLRTLKKMGNIRILGKQTEEIAVTIDDKLLSAYGINSRSILAMLSLQGVRTIGGEMTSQGDKTLVQTIIPYDNEYELAQQIIFSDPTTNNVVRLCDVATIERRYKKPTKYVEYYEGDLKASSMIISIEMNPSNNIVEFGNEVQAILDETLATLPPDIKVHRITDQPKVVDDSVRSFLHDLLLSIIVVILVMLVLFPLRTALVSSTGVPICTAVAVGIMYICGIELNTVTLAALIVVLGMIVDDSVIVIDGYTELLEKGYSRWTAAHDSTRQLFVPMTLATCAISGMFFPMTHIITGVLGEFVQLFPWTILFALTASIFYAAWVIPYLCTRFIGRQRADYKPNLFERGQHKFFDALQNGYHKLLTFCFRAPWLTLSSGLVIVGLGIWLFTKSNVQMLPKADREMFALEMFLVEGSSLEATAVVADSMAHVLLADPRVTSITSFVGQSSPRFHATYAPQMAHKNYAQFVVNTSSVKDTRELIAEYGPIYEHHFPNAYVRFKQLDYQAVKNPIEVYINGDDLELSKQWADTIKTIFAQESELTWIHSNVDEAVQTIQVRLKPDEANNMGLTQLQLSLYLAMRLGGEKLTTVWEDDYAVPTTLYTVGTDTMSFEEIGNLLVPTVFPGTWVPLRQVADIIPMWHDSQIYHRNNIRNVTVGADLRQGAPATRILKRVQKEIAKRVEPNLPPNTWISYGGLQVINKTVMPELILSVIAALMVMLILMLYHFGKISVALLALSMSVLCLFGTTLGLNLFQLDFSITALLGMVSLIGIIVRNAIIMYEYAEKLRFENGYSARDAAFEAGLRRMRPIFLTSATTALGVLPMVLARTGLWMPMGVVICFGTIFTLPLVVTVMPIAYWKVCGNRFSKQRRIKKNG